MTSTSLRPEPHARRRQPRPYRPRVLRDAGISPSKSLGQHFLTDQSVVSRIIAGAALTRDDTVIEVGPGLGVLTERLSEAAGRVVAVELDARLAARLRERFEGSNVTIVERDILKVTPQELLEGVSPSPRKPVLSTVEGERGQGGEVYAVVGNLPYNIGAAVLRHFLESTPQPRFMVVMLQREVAAAVCAQPGELGLLGVSVQVYATTKRLINVPPRAFAPPPKVTSSVIRLDVRPAPLVSMEERDAFFRVVRAGFSAPRKQLANTLAQGLGKTAVEVREAVVEAAIDPTVRPSELSVDDWRRLASVLGASE